MEDKQKYIKDIERITRSLRIVLESEDLRSGLAGLSIVLMENLNNIFDNNAEKIACLNFFIDGLNEAKDNVWGKSDGKDND